MGRGRGSGSGRTRGRRGRAGPRPRHQERGAARVGPEWAEVLPRTLRREGRWAVRIGEREEAGVSPGQPGSAWGGKVVSGSGGYLDRGQGPEGGRSGGRG